MAGMHWTDGSPEQIAKRLQALVAQAPNVVYDVAVDEASRAESEMKERAKWTDRTSHARGGLFGKAEKTGSGSRINLGGTMEYQPPLELGTKHNKPYPIIVPVANETKVTATEQAGQALMDLLR